MRRLRTKPAMRRLVADVTLAPSDFILPIFVKEGLDEGTRSAIASLPGVFQHSIASAVAECREAQELGIPAVMLFGIPLKKDAQGTGAYDPDGIVPQAVRAITAACADLVIACDVCLCEYTDHGHCAPLDGDALPNDDALALYAKAAVTYAEAGADIIAPSGMMDGTVAALRTALDDAGHYDVAILSYAIKYASALYGPFRIAADSGVCAGPCDRKTHQMDPASSVQAFREAELDIAEGVDMLMVKPALPYLDIIRALADSVPLPLAAYQVSGEYAMIKAAAERGWLDETAAMLEALTAIKRAGATMIITYFAKEAAAVIR